MCNLGEEVWKGDKKRTKCSPLFPGGTCGYEVAKKDDKQDFRFKTKEEKDKWVVLLEGTHLLCGEAKAKEPSADQTATSTDQTNTDENKSKKEDEGPINPDLELKSFDYENPGLCTPCGLKAKTPYICKTNGIV